MENRKQLEADFHDRMRGVYEKDPDNYSRYLSNKKYYAVAGPSQEYFESLMRRWCKGADVLDYGCGSGALTFKARDMGSRSVTGIDISSDSVEECQAKMALKGIEDGLSFFTRDCEATEFADQSFDVVLVSGVLHHLDLDNAYSEIGRVLRPGGVVLCHEALRHNPFIQLYRRRTTHLRTDWETDHILGEPDIDHARKFFSVVDKKFFHLFSLAAVPFRKTRLFEPLHRALVSVDEKLLQWRGMRRWAWMCVFVLHKEAMSNGRGVV